MNTHNSPYTEPIKIIFPAKLKQIKYYFYLAIRRRKRPSRVHAALHAEWIRFHRNPRCELNQEGKLHLNTARHQPKSLNQNKDGGSKSNQISASSRMMIDFTSELGMTHRDCLQTLRMAVGSLEVFLLSNHEFHRKYNILNVTFLSLIAMIK